jgi:hypothetical protein
MTNRKTAIIAGAAIALYAVTGAAALAQAPAPGAPAPRADRQDRQDRQAGPGQRTPGERIDRQARFERGGHERRDPAEHLKAVLQLKPSQDAALATFLAAMKPQEPKAQPASAPALKTTTERLAAEEKRLDDRVAQAKSRIAATRAFYNQLDAGQKRAFDEMAPMIGGRGAGPGMGRRVPAMMPMPMGAPMGPMAPPPPRS